MLTLCAMGGMFFEAAIVAHAQIIPFEPLPMPGPWMPPFEPDGFPRYAAPAVPSAPPHPVRNARSGQDFPREVSIPSINLRSSVVGVGVNKKGEMDVPSGRTNNVGWYKNGTVPGTYGSAVFDAHVFAAFKRLREVKVGDDIFVKMNNGASLHFRVENVRTYPLSHVPPELLFGRDDDERLNLITCAGSLTANRSTYDHRLIVYTRLVDK